MCGAATQSRQFASRERRPAEETFVQTEPAPDGEIKQEYLPPLRWQLLPDGERFAHPAEVELARLLTFYGIRWAYEPTTFAVRWGSDGHPTEFVTPDFFLPEHELYLELTTMRQRLVTRKNRKFRLLRESYPNIRVRMLYLRDFERLQSAFSLDTAPAAARIGATLFAEQDVEARVVELAEQLTNRWRSRPVEEWRRRPLLIGTGSGCDRFLVALRENVRRLGVAVDSDRVELTSITKESTAARARIMRPPRAPVAGRPVIIVQEVLSTGFSATFLAAWLLRHGATAVEVCALLDRAAARVVDVPVVCRGFEVPDVALTGFGLARWQAFRDFPDIAELEIV
jgi:hypoxanthine phosphoribosyltransferase